MRPASDTLGLSALPLLNPRDSAEVRARAIFDLGKFDPQCGDIDVLAPFALTLDADIWKTISEDAVRLAAELLAVEAELRTRPELHALLAIPGRIRRALAKTSHLNHQGEPRVVRFDFHPTTDGWMISEANNDVPGGFIEASGLPQLMREATFAGTPTTSLGVLPDSLAALPPNPTTALVNAILKQTQPGDRVGLIHATAYSDDRQVMLWMAHHLQQHTREAILLAPEQVEWRDGRPRARTDWQAAPLHALIRFFPAEWLVDLPRSIDLAPYLTSTAVPYLNPASALLTQSKRLPLLRGRLRTPMPTWERMLPETCEPQRALRSHPEWILKPALGRVGEGVAIHGVTAAREIQRCRRSARLASRHWITQRRFHALPLATPLGPRYPCLGIFVIDGRACGIYGRLATRPLIDSQAQDIAILITPSNPTLVPSTRMTPYVAGTCRLTRQPNAAGSSAVV